VTQQVVLVDGAVVGEGRSARGQVEQVVHRDLLVEHDGELLRGGGARAPLQQVVDGRWWQAAGRLVPRRILP